MRFLLGFRFCAAVALSHKRARTQRTQFPSFGFILSSSNRALRRCCLRTVACATIRHATKIKRNFAFNLLFVNAVVVVFFFFTSSIILLYLVFDCLLLLLQIKCDFLLCAASLYIFQRMTCDSDMPG